MTSRNPYGASQVALVAKNPLASADVRDAGAIPGLGRCPGIGNGNSFLPGKFPGQMSLVG